MIFAQYSIPLLALFCCTNFHWTLSDPAANICPITQEKKSECSKKFIEIEKMPVKYVKVGEKVSLECPQLSDAAAGEETSTYAWTLPESFSSHLRQSLRRRRRQESVEEETAETSTFPQPESREEETTEILTRPPTTNQPQIDLTISSSLQNGQYACEASNSHQKLRRIYKIEVGTPAEIEQKNEVKLLNYVEVGKSFTQACQATGTPEPTVKWFFNDKPIEVTGNSFEIPSMEYANEGKYECHAENKHGSDKIEFNVAVGVKPEILYKETFHYQFVYGNPLFIDCNVAKGAIPEPKITWVVDENQNVELTTLDNGTLKIDPLTEKFNGYLKCVAENEIGRDEKRIDLHVCGEPYSKTKLHCGNQLNESTAILHNECSIYADDRQYFLKMQSDGNFVVYKGTDRQIFNAEWSGDTYLGHPQGQHYKATLHADGKVTVIDEAMEDKKQALKWYLPGNSMATKPWSHKFVLQNSGRLEHIFTNEQTGETEVVWQSSIGSNKEPNMNAVHKKDRENECGYMDVTSCYKQGLAGPNKTTPTPAEGNSD